MTNVYFQPVNDPGAENPDYEETGCQCPPGDNQYLLELEEGGVSLVHAACGKQPPANWGDWTDLVSMGPIPVTLNWERECDGSPWHGMTPCDDGSYIALTPTSAPEDIGPQALELVRDFLNPGSCTYDNLGHCKTHGVAVGTNTTCTHARARALLAALETKEPTT